MRSRFTYDVAFCIIVQCICSKNICITSSTSRTEIDISSDDAKSLETSYDSDIILTVVDKMGMPVMKVNVEGLPYNLDTSKLPNGEYIIQIISQPKGREAMIDSIKLIVSK